MGGKSDSLASNSGPDPNLVLDGVRFAYPEFWVAWGVSETNVGTLAHELGHCAFSMPDLYYYGIGGYALSGPTITKAFSPEGYQLPNAYERLHLGWNDPVVVTRDGYYDIGEAGVAGDAFILYEPSYGTNRFLIVENRSHTDPYEQIPDNGLQVWRVNEAFFWKDMTDGGTLIEYKGPGGSGSAWDAGDPATPQRSFKDILGNVLAIGRAGTVMRAYFDVDGPGMLVDTGPTPPVIDTYATIPAAVPFMVANTGTQNSIADVAYDLPPGWTADGLAQISFTSIQPTDASVGVTPSPGAVPGDYEVTIRAVDRPSGIGSEARAIVRVGLMPTGVSYTGPATLGDGNRTSLQAKVYEEMVPREEGTQVFGAQVTFQLRSDRTVVATLPPALTDEDGYADVPLPGGRWYPGATTWPSR